jgi:hypothetical protein
MEWETWQALAAGDIFPVKSGIPRSPSQISKIDLKTNQAWRMEPTAAPHFTNRFQGDTTQSN